MASSSYPPLERINDYTDQVLARKLGYEVRRCRHGAIDIFCKQCHPLPKRTLASMKGWETRRSNAEVRKPLPWHERLMDEDE